jgi:hypothetical protein
MLIFPLVVLVQCSPVASDMPLQKCVGESPALYGRGMSRRQFACDFRAFL